MVDINSPAVDYKYRVFLDIIEKFFSTPVSSGAQQSRIFHSIQRYPLHAIVRTGNVSLLKRVLALKIFKVEAREPCKMPGTEAVEEITPLTLASELGAMDLIPLLLTLHTVGVEVSRRNSAFKKALDKKDYVLMRLLVLNLSRTESFPLWLERCYLEAAIAVHDLALMQALVQRFSWGRVNPLEKAYLKEALEKRDVRLMVLLAHRVKSFEGDLACAYLQAALGSRNRELIIAVIEKIQSFEVDALALLKREYLIYALNDVDLGLMQLLVSKIQFFPEFSGLKEAYNSVCDSYACTLNLRKALAALEERSIERSKKSVSSYHMTQAMHRDFASILGRPQDATTMLQSSGFLPGLAAASQRTQLAAPVPSQTSVPGSGGSPSLTKAPTNGRELSDASERVDTLRRQ